MIDFSLLDIKAELARRSFWKYCNLREPNFYKLNRPHLVKLCNILEKFYYNKLLKENGEPYNKLMIRLPPQHGKSRTLVNFTQWCLGKNNEERIITASNTDAQATDFSRYTRDGIQEIKNTPDQIVFSDIFPDTKIKRGDSSVQKWALENQFFSYKGVGVRGTITGKGATLRIIDDLVKDAEQALSSDAMNKIWIWLAGTFSSRNSAEAGIVKEIFCATIWGENDPQKILEETEGDEWYIMSMPIYDAKTDKMLCDDFMNKKEFEKLKKRMLIDSYTKKIFYANYMCDIITDNENNVFPESVLKTYKTIPTEIVVENGKEVEREQGWTFSVIDTADEGKDNYSQPIFQVIGNYVFLKDVIFNQDNLTLQEPQVIAKYKQHKFSKLVIETNSFGAYFKRRITTKLPQVEVFGQWNKGNKMARILSYAGIIKMYFLFPEKPNSETERFMKQVFKLQKTSKNEDDAPDSLAIAARHLEAYYNLFKD